MTILEIGCAKVAKAMFTLRGPFIPNCSSRHGHHDCDMQCSFVALQPTTFLRPSYTERSRERQDADSHSVPSDNPEAPRPSRGRTSRFHGALILIASSLITFGAIQGIAALTVHLHDRLNPPVDRPDVGHDDRRPQHA